MRRIALALTALLSLTFAAQALDPAKTPPITARQIDTNALTLHGPGSTGPIDGMSVTPLPGMVARFLSTSLADLPVRPEQYRLASDPDDTLSFQRAAATGRTIALRDGATYTLCASIPVLRVTAPGGGATIQACTGFAFASNGGSGQPVHDAEPGNSFFHNPNYLAGTITDAGILVENVRFVATGVPAALRGQFHAVKIRMARGVRMRGLRCEDVGDCTAIQASDDTLIDGGSALGVVNAGWDHWEGTTNATVQNTVTTCSALPDPNTGAPRGADAGVMFTASSSAAVPGNAGSARITSNVVSRNNRVLGGMCRSGIWANTLSPSPSAVTGFVSEGDYVDAAGSSTAAGIILSGNIKNAKIINPTLANGAGLNAIVTRGEVGPGIDPGVKPSGAQIINPTLLAWNTDASNYAPIALLGTGHDLTGAKTAGGVSAYAVYTESGTTRVSGTFDTVSSGQPVRADGGINAGCVAYAGKRSCEVGTGDTVTVGGLPVQSASVPMSYSPTVVCASGSLGSNAAPTATYTVNAKRVSMKIHHSISAFGSCAGAVYYAAPTAVAADTDGGGRNRSDGSVLSVLVIQAAGSVQVQNYTGGTPATTSGYDITVAYDMP